MESDIVNKLENLNLGSPELLFPSKNIETLAKHILDGRFTNIVVMTGAGISVNAGIPDFRSKGGLYEKMKAKGYPIPEIVFSLDTFKADPKVFYQVAGDLDTTKAKPTLTHYFFKLLEEKNLLLKCYTQNIDSLEFKAGVSREKVVQAHGHFNSAHCVGCQKEGDPEKVLEGMSTQQVYYCEKCGKAVKPDVVFFGEKLPEEFNECAIYMKKCDLLLIVGTSLAVQPFSLLPNFVNKGVPRVFINKYCEPLPSFQFSDPTVPDISLEGDCDQIFNSLAEHLGWKSELDSLIENISYMGSLDFGTGSTRFLLFDNHGDKHLMHQIELTQYFPAQNFHEQNPLEYITTALTCIEKALENSSINLSKIKCIGISNQRETIIAWDKTTGKPLYNSIIWDDARTGDICEEFSKHSDKIREKTGLPVSTYFSATKIVWLIRNVPEVAAGLKAKTCVFGTLESWVIWSLTENQPHVTDISNASRTMLMNLTGEWDLELLEIFGIPLESLPVIVSNSERYGNLKQGPLKGVPISGAIGDQQAALLGHMCLSPGDAKCTYGTGAFLLMNIGETPKMSTAGLLTTVYAKFGKKDKIKYAFEGAVESAGSAVKWMMNSLGLFSSYEELEEIAGSVEDCGGVYCVPAFSGIFAPYWNNEAKGVIVGLTQHTTKAHIARAILEGVCFRTGEIIEAMVQDSGRKMNLLSVDGGMTNNKLFMREQAIIGKINVEIPVEKDLTAFGAALAAGIGAGVFGSIQEVKEIVKKIERTQAPEEELSEGRKNQWKAAVNKCLLSKL